MSKYTVCGYDIDILHERMLQIAIEVDRICREQGFKCSLYGGSVLGAIRHNGFIPWDHDIDMCMPRKDYDRFVKYMAQHSNEKIFFSNYKSEKRYLFGYRFSDLFFLAIINLKNDIQIVGEKSD